MAFIATTSTSLTLADLDKFRRNCLFDNVVSRDSVTRFNYYRGRFLGNYLVHMDFYLNALADAAATTFVMHKRIESLCFDAFYCVEMLIKAAKGNYVMTIQTDESQVYTAPGTGRSFDALPSTHPNTIVYREDATASNRCNIKKVSTSYANNVYINYLSTSNHNIILSCKGLGFGDDFINQLDSVNTFRNELMHKSIDLCNDSYINNCILNLLENLHYLFVEYRPTIDAFLYRGLILEEHL